VNPLRSRALASLAVALVVGGAVGALGVLALRTLGGEGGVAAAAVAAVVVLGLGAAVLLGGEGSPETTYW